MKDHLDRGPLIDALYRGLSRKSVFLFKKEPLMS
jgi:hypothetical protein